jgi:signal peptidase
MRKSGQKTLLSKVFNWFLMLLLVVIVLVSTGIFVAPYFGWNLNVVNGGSMEPAIKMGSLAVVQPADAHEINVGDVILFKASSASDKCTTHRVYEITNNEGVLTFRTKGDANEDPDSDLVAAENIIGRVRLTVPHAGYFMEFIRKPVGFGIVFGIPATLLIMMELRNICRNARAIHRKNVIKRYKNMKDRQLRQAAE